MTWQLGHLTIELSSSIKAFSAAGIAAVDYANWFESTWHVSFTGQEPKTTIVQNDTGILDSYAENNVLFQEFIITKSSV